MILYRPVGLQELALIYDSGMKAFPARLPQQPIFYPVLQLTYARQTASGWNARNGEFAGYVTQFKVEDADAYIAKFEKHTVGGSQHQELWIPAEEVEEFNRHIIGHIKVLEAYFGDVFQGFVPEAFGLQGKNAVEQFTLLANSYLYQRMDFFLEIRRNHKAVFLNYPFWQTYEFKNPGLKEKVLQAIREAWLTSFPKTPLPMPVPVHEDTTDVEQTDSHAQRLIEPVHEDFTSEGQGDAHADAQRLAKPVSEDSTPVKKTVSHAQRLVNPLDEDPSPVEQPDSHAQRLVNPVHEETAPSKQTDAHAHLVQGINWGLSGRYHEAIAELSKAVEEDPDNVIARTSLGVAFHRLGEDDRALACYEAALRVDPIYAEAHCFRANILYGHGNVREAIAGYTVAIGLKPELIRAHAEPAPRDRLTDYTRSPAEMYWIARPAHRILDLTKSLETNPGQADMQAQIFRERAAEYYRLRNYVQAIADYSSSLETQPDDASVLHLRGVAYEQLEQFDRALQDYQRATAIDPQLPDVYINRGIASGNTGNFRQSIASFSQAIRLAPENPDGYFNRGTSYFQLGDFERAIEDFSNAIRLSPGDEAAYYWRGVSHEEAGREPEAIADYRQFLVLSQNANARQEVEQRLRQWEEGKPEDHAITSDLLIAKIGRWVNRLGRVSGEWQKTDHAPSGQREPNLDLYALISALGERALESIWLASGVECYGDSAEELYALTSQNQPIEGGDLFAISAGIRQTLAGDFHAFDPGASSHWLFFRAWEGNGFYIETNDTQVEKELKTHFQGVEEVEGANHPYAGLFIRN